ncbi:MAG: hypothetical protein HDS67_03315 [Bacteroidales bacterium]|nr:hypothetical protein [Bacteroidales bacterium]
MAEKLSFTLAQYQEAATIYRKDLLMLLIIGIQESLQYMTGRPGLTANPVSHFSPLPPHAGKILIYFNTQ